MTLLDDDVDDLLQAFRADEALLDDATRARMWDRICTDVPDAPAALDALVPYARVRRLRDRAGRIPRARVLGVAAAVLILLAIAGVVVGSGPDDGAVTAGPAPTAPLPRTIEELADVVAARPVDVLGTSADTRYAYQRFRLTYGGAGLEPSVNVQERWIGRDGSGQVGEVGTELSPEGPGTFLIGELTPEAALALPAEGEGVAAVFDGLAGQPPFGREVTPALVALLATPGLPAPARAGLLRSLIIAGFVPVSAPDLAPTVMRVEGPGPDGSTMQADLDLLTGEVTRSARINPDGTGDEWVYIEVDLRADLRGS